MVRIGLVGEDPNDTLSIKNLLEKRYKGKAHFIPLVKGITGDQLDSPKIERSLPVEFEEEECEFVVYIRDLDAFKSQTKKLNDKIQWFKKLDGLINNSGVLLLNIWELEALIFGDKETLNRIYKINYRSSKNPMLIQDPKRELKRLTSKSKMKYAESYSPVIFNQLDIDKVENNCSCFREFIIELDARLKVTAN